MDALDQVDWETGAVTPKFSRNEGKGDALDHYEEQLKKQEIENEPWWKSLARTALQIPKGIAAGTTYGITTGLMNLLGTGEALDPEEIEHIKKISEREGIPFDEEKYLQAVQGASEAFPTVENISKGIEAATGIPLEAHTGLQKFINFASTAGKLAPKDATLIGLNTSLPKPVLGTAVAGAKEALEAAGVPEPISEVASFAVLKQPKAGAGKIGIGKKTKESGLTERGFENLKKPHEVSEKKLNEINTKLKEDFTELSDKIIKESPVGETAENLRSDPLFKQESRDLLQEAQNIADNINKNIDSKIIAKELATTGSKKFQGYSPSEYDFNYGKYLKESIKKLPKGEISAGQLVQQYRKNNRALGEYFEPGSSKALNRAKRDALLDENRAIANIMETAYPDSKLSTVFKEGNERWTKIMDAEAVDGFIEELFKEGVNYKKMNRFLDSNGYEFSFKRALGDKGYKDFVTLVKDMLSSEKPYKMLKVAKDKGYTELYETGLSYVMHPKLGLAKTGYDILKSSYKGAVNALLDKPKLSITWKKAIDDLKAGNFSSAEKRFNTLHGEILKEEKPNLPYKLDRKDTEYMNKKKEALKKYNERKKSVKPVKE